MKRKRSNSARDRYLRAALRIEEENTPDPILIKILDAMEDRLTYHRSNLLKEKAFHSQLQNWFSVLIPILSALVTSLATLENKHCAELAGFILTILTVINSALRPSEKSLNASYMLVRLHDWEMDLIIALQGLQGQEKEKTYAYLKNKDSELSRVGAEIVDIMSPNRRSANFPDVGQKESPRKND